MQHFHLAQVLKLLQLFIHLKIQVGIDTGIAISTGIFYKIKTLKDGFKKIP